MVSAVGRMKVTVGSVQVAVHLVQVTVCPCLSRCMMLAVMVSAVSGVEAGVLGVERPVGAVVLPVRGRPVGLLCLGRWGSCQQHKHGGGYRQKRSQFHCVFSVFLLMRE